MLGSDRGTFAGGIEAMDLPTEPGKRARAIRTALRLTRVNVARSAGLTIRQIAATERGRRELTQAQWRSLAGSLGVEPALLVPADLLSVDDPDTEAQRIDEFVGHDPDHEWNALPRTAADLPPALPVDLPDPERRSDEHTRARIERSWSEIRRDLDEVIVCCNRLVGAGSGDDPEELLAALDVAARKVHDQRSFQRHVANHRKALSARRHRGEIETISQPAQRVEGA